MSAYVIANVTVKDPGPYEQYKKMAQESIAKYGGRYIARGGETVVIDGNWRPSRLVLLEFESMARAREWWDSPEYTAARKVRESCSTGEFVFTSGL
jgi:uncharacterized protein (DUF1330 family)